TSDPNRSSLGLLPSGPDPVGEWLVHRQPPRLYIGRNGRQDKDGPICYRAPDIRPGSWGQPQSIVVLVTRTISVARRKPWREGAFPPQRLVSRQRLRLIGQIPPSRRAAIWRSTGRSPIAFDCLRCRLILTLRLPPFAPLAIRPYSTSSRSWPRDAAVSAGPPASIASATTIGPAG